MVCLVSTTKDEISAGITAQIVEPLGLKIKEETERYAHLTNGNVEMLRFHGRLINLEDLDELVKTELFVFLSQHKSASGKISMTVHPQGNWTDTAELGGRPKELSVSSPDAMQGLLKTLKKNNDTEVPVIYEATHHGPLLKTPSLFFEVGGPGGGVDDRFYKVMGKALIEWLDNGTSGCEKVAFGIGAGHYPDRFTALSLESKYSFTHFMPKYQSGQLDMIEQGITRSNQRAQCALIDWKGLKSEVRTAIIKRLDELGVEHVRM